MIGQMVLDILYSPKTKMLMLLAFLLNEEVSIKSLQFVAFSEDVKSVRTVSL